MFDMDKCQGYSIALNSITFPIMISRRALALITYCRVSQSVDDTAVLFLARPRNTMIRIVKSSSISHVACLLSFPLPGDTLSPRVYLQI